MKKLMSLVLIFTLAFTSVGSVFASEVYSHNIGKENEENLKSNLSSSFIPITEDIIEKADPFVKINKSTGGFEISEKALDVLTTKEFISVSEAINQINREIKEITSNKMKYNYDKILIVDKSNELAVKGNELIENRDLRHLNTSRAEVPLRSGGITQVVIRWTHIDIYLSSRSTRNVAIGGTGALIGAIGTIPGLGKPLVAAIAGGIGFVAGDLVSGVQYPPLVYRVNHFGRNEVTYQIRGGRPGSFWIPV